MKAVYSRTAIIVIAVVLWVMIGFLAQSTAYPSGYYNDRIVEQPVPLERNK